jgi:hypothetical protein
MPPKIKEFHVIESGVTLPNEQGKAYVCERGDTFTVTEKMITASLDRLGNSFIDTIERPDVQLARWGKVYLAPGPCTFTVTPEAPALYVREPHSADKAPYVYPETVTVVYPNVGVRR